MSQAKTGSGRSTSGPLSSEPVTRSDWEAIRAEAERVYARNEVDIEGIYYHMPSADIYPSIFAWDSGFHAITLLHLDPEKAGRELETLFSQVAEDGHMPHEVLLPSPGRMRLSRRIMAWLSRGGYDRGGATYFVDPPAFIVAAEMVYRKTRDSSWLERIWPNVRRSLDYLLEERDLFGDGLVTIIHPWEAGTDLTPQFFEALGLDEKKRLGGILSLVRLAALFWLCSRNRWDPRRLFDENRFVFEELTMNFLTVKACRSSAYLAGELGEKELSERYESRALAMMKALDEMCWDEEAGCYFPRWDARKPRLARRKTADSLNALFTGLCSRERAQRLIEEHVLNGEEFWPEYLFPFNPMDELRGARSWVEHRLWAGHCIWINFNWMVSIGLEEYGYRDDARELTRRTVKMLLREGFWEYYDSRTGAGRRVSGFGWTGLALDMMARFWPEVTGA